MKQELIKPIIRVGNSAGVLLPREWLNGQAKIVLVENPIDIQKDSLQILAPYLEDIIGIYLVGSYARNEQTPKSDIDIVAISKSTNKHIKKGKYDIILIEIKSLEESLKENVLPILPMLKEAKPLMNPLALEEYKKTAFTNKNLRFHFETTQSSLKVIEEAIKLAELEQKTISENLIYSLILRLREAYTLDLLIKNKTPTTKTFVRLVKKLTGSSKAHAIYLDIKNEEKAEKGAISINEARNIYGYILKRLSKQKEWIKDKESR